MTQTTAITATGIPTAIPCKKEKNEYQKVLQHWVLLYLNYNINYERTDFSTFALNQVALKYIDECMLYILIRWNKLKYIQLILS